MLSESVCNPAQAALPTNLCEHLETRIASGALELPILPHVASQVLALSTSDEAHARSLAELLHRDQAIAAHVLRVANSPLYRPCTLVSLQQAISRLGLATLREIVITVSMQSRIFNVPSYATEARALWQHAVYTAAYAGKIARRCRRNAEGAFLGGLLHDVSKPSCSRWLTCKHSCKSPYHRWSQRPWTCITRLVALLASTWTLPGSLRKHGVPPRLQRCTRTQEAAMVICLADRVAYALVQPDIALEHLRHDPLWTQLNLYPDDVEALLGEHQAIVQFAEAIG